MNQIPTDEKQYQRLVMKVKLRLMRSSNYLLPRRVEWVRFYKIWRKIQDTVSTPTDEPNIFLGYAFALVEQINSKITEPILKMQPPFKPMPMKLGDGAAADNFRNVARNWYAKPNVQEALLRSKKEMVICGPRVEIDEWLNVRRPGKRWGKQDQEVEKALTDTEGKPLLGRDGQPVIGRQKTKVDAEVPHDVCVHYGFHTRYPSIFDCYPEPDKKTIGTGMPTDVSWFVEDMGERALEEMCRESYVDPKDGATKPLYDFSRLLKDAGRRAEERYAKIMQGGDAVDDNYGPLITPQHSWDTNTDYSRINKNTVYPSESTVDRASTEDRDKVWIVRHYEAGEIVTIAQGRYVIQRVLNPWHTPILPIRVENYTTDPEFLFGRGALQPIEDEIYELNDIHNLSMANFIRIVNKMMAVNVGALVDPTMGDFAPRAGGKVRIKPEVSDANMVISQIDQQDPTGSMMAQESNTRGLISYTAAAADLSQGSNGTKQTHKTYKGLVEVLNTIDHRFTTMQRQALINEARRGASMERFFAQFAFEKMPYRLYHEDGSTTLAMFDRSDIDTEGRGFEFAIEIDPTFGDTAVQRQQNLFLFDRGVEYEKLRREIGDPTWRKVELSKLFERTLKDFGHADTSGIFVRAEGEMSPDQELEILAQGGVVRCAGDLMHHVESHLLQLGSPKLKAMVEAGKAHPETLNRLRLLVEEDLARLKAFAADPMRAAEKKLNSVGASAPRMEV